MADIGGNDPHESTVPKPSKLEHIDLLSDDENLRLTPVTRRNRRPQRTPSAILALPSETEHPTHTSLPKGPDLIGTFASSSVVGASHKDPQLLTGAASNDDPIDQNSLPEIDITNPPSNEEVMQLIRKTATRATKLPQRIHSKQLDPPQRHSALIRRAHTTQLTHTASSALNYQFLANEMYRALIGSLQSEHIDVSRFTQESLRFLLPRPESTPQQIEVYETIRDRPMSVTTADLEKIFRLQLSTATSGPLASGFHYFYMRSYTFTWNELKRICEVMTDGAGHTYVEVLNWRKVLEIHETRAAQPFFTVRYFGTVQGPDTPYNRFLEDMRDRRSGILSEFLHYLVQLFPEILAASEVYLFQDATLKHEEVFLKADPTGTRPPLTHQQLSSAGQIHQVRSALQRDDMERALIAAFDHRTLLNRQRGGFYGSYLPSVGDAKLFTDLKTRFYARFYDSATSAQPEIIDGLDEIFHQIQDYAKRNPNEAGTTFRPFSDRLRIVCRDQAMPLQVSKTTILALVGKDITLEDYVEESSFFDGRSRAATVTKDMIRRLAVAEAESHRDTIPSVNFDPKMPFIDLWPYLKHYDIIWVISCLRSILSVTRPLVLVSFSREVNAITRADFHHQMGISSRQGLTQLVGEYSIQYYGVVDENATVRDPETAFINIVHIDPGNDKYFNQSTGLRRVFDLTWQLTFLVCDIALTVVESYAKGTSKPSRLDICQQVLDTLEHRRESDLKTSEFFDVLGEVKQNLVRENEERYGHSAYSKFVLDAGTRRNISRLGHALGEPHSEERREQIESLWDQNMPDLHLAIPHEGDRHDEWVNAFLALQPGQSYFLQVISSLQEHEYIRELLRQCPDTSWLTGNLDDPDIFQTAIVRSGLWIQKRALEAEKSIIGRQFPAPFLDTAHMNGSFIGLTVSNGQGLLRWRHPDPKRGNVTIRLRSKAAITKSAAEIRQVYFTAEGIDIVDAKGNPLRPKRQKDASIYNTATVPKSRFKAIQDDGADLEELWKDVRRFLTGMIPESVKDSEQDEDPSRPVKVWDDIPTDGIGPTPVNVKKEKPIQPRPPRRQDANWLVMTFIDDQLPDGGGFRTISSARAEVSHLDLFLVFLKSPEYRGHPYAKFWLSKLEDEANRRTGLGLLARQLRILRSFQRHVSKHMLPSGMFSETWYTLGAIGSQGLNQFGNLPDSELSIGPDAQGQGSSSAPRAGRPQPKKRHREGEDGGDDNDDEGGGEGEGTAHLSKSSKRGRGRPRKSDTAAPTGSSIKGKERAE